MIKTNKKMVSAMHRAIKEYSMIQDGDKIAVGISGGKDSLMLLVCLAQYRKQVKFHFDLVAIIIDIFQNDYGKIQEFCNQLNVPLFIEKSNIKQVVFDIRQEKNPCSLCANLRRGILNSKAKELGCNKVALGHHADDFVQTFFMSITNENRLSTFWPKTFMSRLDLEVIRPMLYVWERDIELQSENFPIIKNTCPANKNTNREATKKIIQDLDSKIPNFKKNLHSAICRTERYNLFDKINKN